ncbi:rho GDP-dissociation inhibitor 1 [Phalaenopsis equestris]|uniref:rho GDP-dissociation inhibitor 1 n=1 Tax=Phalaenopsis equestris TaxID=78828 RepID=UPI0009E58946|nr:rho GDP-dissociation inhibitor 1 [Phalaenopsis equestris]
MSLTAGACSSFSKVMDLEENKETGKTNGNSASEVDGEEKKEEENGKLGRCLSEFSLDDEEEEEEDGDADKVLDLGPQVTLKDQMEKDKDDDSLRRWKEQLLGSVDLNSVGDKLDPDVNISCLSIISPGRADVVLPLPVVPNSKGVWFTLKEGSSYRLKFTFSVSNNIVSGLKYINTVWKTGVRVDRTKEMLGTFSPQLEPYIYETPEEITPAGIFARGSYSARTKFIDDDDKCYLEINYTFDIRRDWPLVDPQQDYSAS